jgi:hypothetical protein
MKSSPNRGYLIVATKNIDWDGEDCHPPLVLARKGETLVIHKVFNHGIYASHSLLTKPFFLEHDEYESPRSSVGVAR